MFKKIITIVISVVFTLAMISNTSFAEGEKIIVITHGADSDPFWNIIKNSVKEAGKDIKVDIKYLNPKSGSLSDMSQMIIEATRQNPAGIITTIANINVLKKAYKAIVDQKIPFITINAGSGRQAKNIGSIMHIKQPEFKTGYALGRKAKKSGINSFLCVNHQKSIISLEERCRGFADGLGIPFKSQMIDSGFDPRVIENRVMSYLKANPYTSAVLTLGIVSAESVIKVLSKLNIDSKQMFFATFDISSSIIDAIQQDKIDIAVDQQPYLQGYLSVILLTNYIRYDLIPVGNIDSGPNFITKSKIGKIKELAGKYR